MKFGRDLRRAIRNCFWTICKSTYCRPAVIIEFMIRVSQTFEDRAPQFKIPYCAIPDSTRGGFWDILNCLRSILVPSATRLPKETEALGTRMSALRDVALEVIFLLVKSWKTQVIFTVRLVQKQSFVLFVTEGLRFFCV